MNYLAYLIIVCERQAMSVACGNINNAELGKFINQPRQ
jgi:hypothetical protein